MLGRWLWPDPNCSTPSGRRPMKAWVVVRPEHREVWPELAEAALAKVRH
jgi:hypothetical protein